MAVGNAHGKKLISLITGLPLNFTILLVSPELERIALPFARN